MLDPIFLTYFSALFHYRSRSRTWPPLLIYLRNVGWPVTYIYCLISLSEGHWNFFFVITSMTITWIVTKMINNLSTRLRYVFMISNVDLWLTFIATVLYAIWCSNDTYYIESQTNVLKEFLLFWNSWKIKWLISIALIPITWNKSLYWNELQFPVQCPCDVVPHCPSHGRIPLCAHEGPPALTDISHPSHEHTVSSIEMRAEHFTQETWIWFMVTPMLCKIESYKN